MSKLTAVEWLVDQLDKENMFMYLFTKQIKQAKEMEEQQIREAYVDGCVGEMYELSATYTAEQYYNATYKES